MISELFELQAKFEEIEKLKEDFEKYLPEAHDLAQKYIKNTGDYIDRSLGDVVDVTEHKVTFFHEGWEHDGIKEVPLELFTNPSFIKDIIKKNEEKKEKNEKNLKINKEKNTKNSNRNLENSHDL